MDGRCALLEGGGVRRKEKNEDDGQARRAYGSNSGRDSIGTEEGLGRLTGVCPVLYSVKGRPAVGVGVSVVYTT